MKACTQHDQQIRDRRCIMNLDILIGVLSLLVFVLGAVFINFIDKRDRKKQANEDQKES